MKNSHNQRWVGTISFALILTILLSASASMQEVRVARDNSNPSEQRAAGRRFMASPGDLALLSPPEPEKRLVDLKAGKFTFGTIDFVPVDREPELETIRFTAEELKAKVGSHLTQDNGNFYVKVKRKGQDKLFPLDDYVAQLNRYEEFLNRVGCSLREGPFATPSATQQSSSSAGRVLRAQRVERSVGGVAVSTTRRAQVTARPNIMGSFSPIKTCGTLYRLKNFSREPRQVYHDPNQKRVYGEDPNWAGGSRETRRQTVVSPMGRPNATLTVHRPNVIPLVTSPAKKAQVVITRSAMEACNVSTPTPTPTPYIPDSGRNPVCPPGMTCGAPGTSGGTEIKRGETHGAKPQGAPKCLYEGVMSASWNGFGVCTQATGGNGWFGASLCMGTSFSGCLPKDNLLTLSNGASLNLKVILFGESFNLLNAASRTRYDSVQRQPSVETHEVTIGITGDKLSPAELNRQIRFIGPSTIIPIGPVPITVKSGVDASLSFNDQHTNPATFPGLFPEGFPYSCDASSNAKGALSAQLGVNARADLWATASLNAIVAEAGLDARLVLADDTANIFINTTVDPKRNNIVVAPGYGYTLKHLAGILSLFVEVDLILYRKRWSIELFKFDGIEAKGLQPDDKDYPRTEIFGARKAE